MNSALRTCFVGLFLVWLVGMPCSLSGAASGPGVPGTVTVRLLSPTVIEISKITAFGPNDKDVWKENLQRLSEPGTYQVQSDDAPVDVRQVGWRRRPEYAGFRSWDLRVNNSIYLSLVRPIVIPGKFRVTVSLGDILKLDVEQAATTNRLNPAIHISQAGYGIGLPKQAIVGLYLGSMGELDVESGKFSVIETLEGKTVYSGNLVAHPDMGFISVSPAPYQKVLRAEFSMLDTPGVYQISVPGVGVSEPFQIGEEFGSLLARTYALGLYHQRCGTSIGLPWTRFAHDACHVRPAAIPTEGNTFVEAMLEEMSSNAKKNLAHTAPAMSGLRAVLYPFVKRGNVDVSGGHHDAGDYSKYLSSGALMAHHLIFAVDAFPGVASLDNLGIPESGDGISDLLQEAKWELDYILKMQDADGGFYSLVYPENRKYEDNVLPEKGDKQVVFPKTTTATASAVAILAQAASSPAMKKAYPAIAAKYMNAASNGWVFLEAARKKYTKNGSYQQIAHFGSDFMHDDELAWAAAEMFVATGDEGYYKRFRNYYDPVSGDTRLWGWWRLFGGYGCAARSYAFAVRTGRLPEDKLDAGFRIKCEQEILRWAADLASYADSCSYGTSFPLPSKERMAAGWYFSSSQAFDLVVGLMIEQKPEWLYALISNLSYEAGCNPVNQVYVTGLGNRRMLRIVSQFASNDKRMLPPSGIPVGNLQTGFVYQPLYKNLLSDLCYPSDKAAPWYPFYDRWGDAWNAATEQVGQNQSRALAVCAFLMARTSLATQAWKPANNEIAIRPIDGKYRCILNPGPGISSLAGTDFVWESQGTVLGTHSALELPQKSAEQWVEVEATLPDGRRLFGAGKTPAQ